VVISFLLEDLGGEVYGLGRVLFWRLWESFSFSFGAFGIGGGGGYCRNLNLVRGCKEGSWMDGVR
jgi:hypothetical protein